MKILFVSNYFPKPGRFEDAVFLYWRAKHLIQKGHQVTVLKWDQDLKDIGKSDYTLSDIAPEQFEESIYVRRLHNAAVWNPFYMRYIHRWIRDNFDLVHFHWLWSMALFPNIADWNIPYVVTCHGSDIYRLGAASWDQKVNQKRTIFDFKWVQLVNQRVVARQMTRLSRANHTIFVSSDIRKVAFHKHFNGGSYSVIPNGIDQSKFYIDSSRSTKQNTKKVLGFVGMLNYRKRADTLIQLFAYVKHRCPDTEFLVIGEGDLASDMREESARLELTDHVTFTGKIPVEDVAKYMNKMDLFILPSREEAFGCVIKEAQACGAAVVGANVGGIPEAIGCGGAVVDEGADFEKRFAMKVCELLEAPLDNQLIKAAVQNSSWSEVVDQELSVYQSVLSEFGET